MQNYLRRFDEAFDGYDGSFPRSMYHDSYEYNSNWSPDLLAQFERRRGYRLQIGASRAPWQDRRRPGGAGPLRLPRDPLGPPDRGDPAAVGELGPRPRHAHAQPGARVARQPARSLRPRRHPGNGDVPHRPQPIDLEVGLLGRARGGPPPGRRRDRHLAAGALHRDARGHEVPPGRPVPERRQPRDLSWHVLFAGRSGLARLAVLRELRDEPAQPRLARRARAQRRTSPVASPSCRPAPPTTTCCSTGRCTTSGSSPPAWSRSLPSTREAGSKASPSARPPSACGVAATRSTTCPTASSPSPKACRRTSASRAARIGRLSCRAAT